jgi:hypothetical protein
MTSALFSPIKLADLELANRLAVSPMCQYSANDGVADDWHMTHLGMLANSGASFLVIEATHVERHGRITHGCLGLYSDACEAALQRVVNHCRRIGKAKLAIQLAHAGRKASAQRPWEGGKALSEREDPWPTIGPSALPFGAASSCWVSISESARAFSLTCAAEGIAITWPLRIVQANAMVAAEQLCAARRRQNVQICAPIAWAKKSLARVESIGKMKRTFRSEGDRWSFRLLGTGAALPYRKAVRPGAKTSRTLHSDRYR